MNGYVGEHLDARISDVRSIAATERVDRRARWDAAVASTATAWRESFGYKHGPIMDHRMVQREVHEMLRTVIDARLMTMLAPLFVTAEYIDRSILIVSILASPSGAGPERYAPKPGGPERISVQRTPS